MLSLQNMVYIVCCIISTQHFCTFSGDVTLSVNIYDDGNTLSIVTAVG